MKDEKIVKSEGTDGEKAVSPVIGVILMVAITVIVAATVGALITGSAFGNVEEPSTAGVGFDYDYEPGSEKMKVTVTIPGNVERLYITDRAGGFNDSDIVRSAGWLNKTAGKDSSGRIVEGKKIVNEDVKAGDTIILDNITADDDLVLTGDRGLGTSETLLSNWEGDDWTYDG